ncbi:MAG: Eco57I restriction-modification methylase domain-containing protein [Promethearchaeota archaeon]
MDEVDKKKIDFLANFIGIPSKLLILSDSKTNLSEKNGKFIELVYNTIIFFLFPEKSRQDDNCFYNTNSDENTPEIFYEKHILKSQKEKGAFYTPRIISHYISKEIVDIKFDKLLSNIRTRCEENNKTAILAAIHKFNSIKILDPACGSGVFLIELLIILWEKYRLIFEIIRTKIKEKSLREICFKNINVLINIKQNNSDTNSRILLLPLKHIFGIDLDQNAVKSAKISLWLKILVNTFKTLENLEIISIRQITEEIFSVLDKNLKIGDALKIQDRLKISNRPIIGDSDFLKTKFDLIVGNPPYISSKSKDMDEKYKKYLKANYKTAVKQFDLYSIFLERCYYLLKKSGYFGFIIPESYLGRSTFEMGRRLLLENTKILKIDQVKGVFNDPSVANIIIFYKKIYNERNIIQFSRYQSLTSFVERAGESIKIQQRDFLEFDKSKMLFITPKIRQILKKIKKNCIEFGEIIEIHRGEEIGKNSELIEHRIEDRRKKGLKKILFGEDIHKYSINFAEHYITESNLRKKNNYPLYFSPKIVIRQLGDEINVAYDKNGEYTTVQTVYNVILKENSVLYEYILGVLNSKLIQFYYTVMFKEKTLFPRILIENIKKIPIILPPISEQQKIKIFVEKIIKLKEKNQKFDVMDLREKLDSYIFNFYGLNNEEIKSINFYLKTRERK